MVPLSAVLVVLKKGWIDDSWLWMKAASKGPFLWNCVCQECHKIRQHFILCLFPEPESNSTFRKTILAIVELAKAYKGLSAVT